MNVLTEVPGIWRHKDTKVRVYVEQYTGMYMKTVGNRAIDSGDYVVTHDTGEVIGVPYRQFHYFYEKTEE